MTKKQLISSDGVRDAAKRGEKTVYLHDKSAIVTAEAASTAKALGISLEFAPAPEKTVTSPDLVEHGEAAIRRVLAAHTGGEIREDLLTEVKRRIALERESPRPISGGHAVRKLASIQVDDAKQNGGTLISTLDLSALVANQSLPRAVGFMTWANSVVKFKRDHDEVVVVLEGELQFWTDNESVTAKTGDVMLIPKNMPIEIRTQGSSRLFYASYNG